MRTRTVAWSPSVTVTASPGTNLGCVVMMVRPLPLWGSSSERRSRRGPGAMAGRTSFSIIRAMSVLLPVRTGPTTPMYTSPSVRSAISRYRSNVLSMQKPPCVALAKRYARLRARNAKKA